MKKFILIVAAIFLGMLICLCAAGYHGQRDFSASNGALPFSQQVVANARNLAGTPYDPLMGRAGNIGATIGLIVCSDVPNIAYGLSGFSLKRMLEEDYDKNPSGYSDIADGNEPESPYFHRRARNLYAYFKNNNRLSSSASVPRVGDLAFYKRKSHGYVSHVALVTVLREGSYTVMESAPETLIAQEVPGVAPLKRGWILLGFGRMYLGTQPPLRPVSTSATEMAGRVVKAAREQVGQTIYYDPSYRKLEYPNGDVPTDRGVCTDVVIRALRRALGMDLQKLVHEDMTKSFSRYPKKWGLAEPDTNIDHRRVPNLQVYFARMGYSLPVTENAEDYKPADIVTCIVPPNLPHIMIVSDTDNSQGRPLIIHNIGAGAREEDRLFELKLTGHYRLKQIEQWADRKSLAKRNRGRFN